MSVSAKLRRAPLRIATGAYILNSGVTKFGADDDAAKSLRGMATNAYPFIERIEPKTFARTLAVGEMAVGATLLLPIVPPMIAGAALVGFSGALLNMYWHTPGMHEEGNPRPTQRGAALAKDAWMLGIGAGLMADAAFEPAHDRLVEFEATSAKRRARRSRRAQRGERRAQLAEKRAQLAELRAEATAVATERARSARETAMTAAHEYAPVAAEKARSARDSAKHVVDEYGPVAADKARSARDAAMAAAHEYGPVAAEKARSARDAAMAAAHEYGPVAAEKARSARDAAVAAAHEYGPVAAERVKTAKEAAQDAGAKIRDRFAS